MCLQLGDASLSFAHGVRGMRVRKLGHYGRGEKKVNVMMAIKPGNPDLDDEDDGSLKKPRIFYRVLYDKGTSTELYLKFLKQFFWEKLREDEPSRVLMHDNLSLHKSDLVHALVESAGHSVICRPPYRPDIAPIEYAFDMIACEIRRRWQKITSIRKLMREIQVVINERIGMGGFHDLFVKLGYSNLG